MTARKPLVNIAGQVQALGAGDTLTDGAGVAYATLAVTFGTGAPGTPGVTAGDLYFDDTAAIYVGYVWRSAAWHQIA